MPVQLLSLASFFTIEAREYANFSFDEASRTTVRNVILAFCIGILCASLYALYQKQVPGAIIRAFLRADALSPEKAKTAEELGLAKHMLYRFALRHDVTLKKFLRIAEPQKGEKAQGVAPEGEAENTEPSAAPRYYIPEELKYRADVRYDKEGSGPFSIILTIVLSLVLGILLIKFLPAILSVVDHLF